MAMQFSAHSKYLIGFIMQVTECNCSVSILRYMIRRVTGCGLCPHALFLQAQSEVSGTVILATGR